MKNKTELIRKLKQLAFHPNTQKNEADNAKRILEQLLDIKPEPIIESKAKQKKVQDLGGFVPFSECLKKVMKEEGFYV